MLQNISEPCATGYKYKRGTSNIVPFKHESGVDNDGCADLCSNTGARKYKYHCTSYEYTSYENYNPNCKLFDKTEVTSLKASGYHHCMKKGKKHYFCQKWSRIIYNISLSNFVYETCLNCKL